MTSIAITMCTSLEASTYLGKWSEQSLGDISEFNKGSHFVVDRWYLCLTMVKRLVDMLDFIIQYANSCRVVACGLLKRPRHGRDLE